MNPPDSPETPAPATPEALKAEVVAEFCAAAGLMPGSWQQRAVTAPLNKPINSVARLLSDFDATIGRDGIAAGFAMLVSHFVKDPTIRGLENIPREGPLVVASNHPGAYDFMLISAVLGRRDLRIISSTVKLFHAMPNFHAHLIEVGTTPEERRRAIPASARHLETGGAVLIFPSGLVDPDPDIEPGAHQALATWRPGIAALVNQAPGAMVIETIASGMLSRRWINSPLLRIQRVDWQRRKLAEMLQVIQQMVWRRTRKVSPRLTFGPPVSGEALRREAGADGVLPLLVGRAQTLLSEHMAAGQPAGDGTAVPAAAVSEPTLLIR